MNSFNLYMKNPDFAVEKTMCVSVWYIYIYLKRWHYNDGISYLYTLNIKLLDKCLQQEVALVTDCSSNLKGSQNICYAFGPRI